MRGLRTGGVSRFKQPVSNKQPVFDFLDFQRWSDPATWGGAVPGAGVDVIIPASMKVLLDVDTASLGSLTIAGRLAADPARAISYLTAKSIFIDGSLQAGTPTAPFINQFIVTLTGARLEDSVGGPSATGYGTPNMLAKSDGSTVQLGYRNGGDSRCIQISPGAGLLLYGNPPAVCWSKLNQTAVAGSTSLVLKDAVTWNGGDEILIAGSEFYSSNTLGVNTLVRKLAVNASGANLSITVPTTQKRWGALQYVSQTAPGVGQITLTDTGWRPSGTLTGTPVVIDERCPVGNMTRNIVIRGADDADWQTFGFGVHVMAMGQTSKIQIDGVRFERHGQRGVLGRYGFHWHMLSFNMPNGMNSPSDGTLLGPPTTDHYVKNSVFYNGANRAIVIHGTRGVVAQNNVVFGTLGHSVFLEDASERRNVIADNMIGGAREPKVGSTSFALQLHEQDGQSIGPCAIWITNPDNDILRNHTFDCFNTGIWWATPNNTLGLSAAFPSKPINIPLGRVEDNFSSGQRQPGEIFDLAPFDAAGTINTNRYQPRLLEGYGSNDPILRLTSYRSTIYKCGYGGYNNRTSTQDVRGFVMADNKQIAFRGASGEAGTIALNLVCGPSLNNTNPAEYTAGNAPCGFSTYNGSVYVQNNIIINMPAVLNDVSGVFDTSDLYTRSLQKFQSKNVGNLLLNSDGGFRFAAPQQFTDNPQGWGTSLTTHPRSSVVTDPYGMSGPAGNYLVLSHPFLTTGVVGLIDTTPPSPNQKTTSTKFYGVQDFLTDYCLFPYSGFGNVLNVTRLDSSGATIATWNHGYGWVDASQALQTFGNMRHFAAIQGGIYRCDFGNLFPQPKWVRVVVTNTVDAADSFVIGIPFDGTQTPRVYLGGGVGTSGPDLYLAPKDAGNPGVAYSETDPNVNRRGWANWLSSAGISSLAQLQSASGPAFWQDAANNLVWVKYGGYIRRWIGDGGLDVNGAQLSADLASDVSDANLYRSKAIVIF